MDAAEVSFWAREAVEYYKALRGIE